jgi:hypothetical protein
MTTEPKANSFRSAVLSGKVGRHDDLVARTKKGRIDRSAEGLTGVAVPRHERRSRDERGGDRHRLTGETAAVRIGKRKHEVELINVSGGGAMIAGKLDVKLWDPVELQLGENGRVECVVRWIRSERIGLEFAHETRLDCSAAEREALLREVLARSFGDVEFELPRAQRTRKSDLEPRIDPASDQRVADRHPLIWTGVLHHDYQSSPIRVRNISSTGCMIECSAPVRVDTEPLLELSEALSISGTVMWVVGDQVGFQFHSPFDMAQLAESLPDVAPSEWIRPSYLDPEPGADSPWDPRWNRLSVSELRHELEGFMKR